LISRGGKRLRPACVLLASRTGSRARPDEVRTLAVAVELIHTATLLHDDVVDEGRERRGAPASRFLFGNTASILAGDWLLVEALARIGATGRPHLLEDALCALRGMVAAESIQLAARDGPMPNLDGYFRIAQGKTALLFAFALRAGACAAGAQPATVSALDAYGRALGLSFQIIDDVLDLEGSEASLGKSVLQDAREGKASYPLALGAARDAACSALVRAAPARWQKAIWRAELHAALARTHALEDARAEAEHQAARATVCLGPLPEGLPRCEPEEMARGVPRRPR
jgi:octaprenyl-diphosphate synthase